MITPKLENMIHEGIASARTFVCGFGGSNVLEVPEGKYIVIHNIIYMPFYDAPEIYHSNQQDLEILTRINKQIELRSQKTDNHFIVRDSGLFVQVPLSIDTYLVHFSDVAVTLLHVPQIAPMSYVDGNLPITSTILEKPLGYGNLDSTKQVHIYPPDMQYVPENAENAGVTPEPSYRKQFKLDHTINTALQLMGSVAPSGYLLDRAFPIVNIQYVLINKTATDKIQASS